MSINLVLSSNSPWDSTYCTPEGQVLFKAESARSLGRHKITVSRVVPSHRHTLKDEYEDLAVVDWHTFSSDKIIFKGEKTDVGKFFTKKGWSCFGRNRVFTGPDGRQYAWHMGSRVCKLALQEDPDIVVAKFHRKRLGILRDKRPASLEIFKDGQQMVDLIVVTFIYMEKLRKGREESSQSGGGGGGP